jgi:sec-independent protein translocase protein TatA
LDQVRCFYLEERPMFEGLFQPFHLIVIFLVALVVFGPKKLPELGKGLGEAIRGFKKALEGDELDNKQSQGHENEKR